MTNKKLERYKKSFSRKGYKLEKFKGFYGIGYYFTNESDYIEGFANWKYSTDLDITLELL